MLISSESRNVQAPTRIISSHVPSTRSNSPKKLKIITREAVPLLNLNSASVSKDVTPTILPSPEDFKNISSYENSPAISRRGSDINKIGVQTQVDKSQLETKTEESDDVCPWNEPAKIVSSKGFPSKKFNKLKTTRTNDNMLWGGQASPRNQSLQKNNDSDKQSKKWIQVPIEEHHWKQWRNPATSKANTSGSFSFSSSKFGLTGQTEKR
jgi:hypothetical protein